MLKANIQAQIDAKQDQLFKIHAEVKKLDKIIAAVKAQQQKFLKQESELMYECKELQDQLEED